MVGHKAGFLEEHRSYELVCACAGTAAGWKLRLQGQDLRLAIL